MRPIINLIGLLEKAVTGSSSNSDRAKSNLDCATNWIKEEIPSNQSAYEAGEKVGTVGALIISLYNLANGISSILSLLESGNGVFVQIPSLLQDLNAFGDTLTLAGSSGVTIPLDVSSIASITGALFQLSSSNEELSSESDDNSDNEGKWEKVKVENRGSTGRTIPRNINEQIALEQAQYNPLKQAEPKAIIEYLTDRRWLGWQKRQIIYKLSDGSSITIHFNYDPINNLFDDFKIVNPK